MRNAAYSMIWSVGVICDVSRYECRCLKTGIVMGERGAFLFFACRFIARVIMYSLGSGGNVWW